MLFKDKLKKNNALLGMFMLCPAMELIEILGYCQFDYAVIDLEHGSYGIDTAAQMVRAAQASGLSPLIRVSSNDAVAISKALDMGAEGLIIPGITTKEDAERALKYGKFSPIGKRGANPFVRSNFFGLNMGSEYYQKANEETSIILLVEGEEGVKNFKEIIAVEGVDAITIGPYDLAQSLGVPGQINAPEVMQRMDEMIYFAKNHKIAVGIFTTNLKELQQWKRKGVALISYSIDTKVFLDTCQQIKREF